VSEVSWIEIDSCDDCPFLGDAPNDGRQNYCNFYQERLHGEQLDTCCVYGVVVMQGES